MQWMFYDRHQLCFADEQIKLKKSKHWLKITWRMVGGMANAGHVATSEFSASRLRSPASTSPQEHTAPSRKVGRFTPGCPYKSPQAAPWISLPFHNCFSQKAQSKRLTSLSVQTSLLIYWSTWLLESHVTQASSKDLHVLASVVSDTHSHWHQGILCLEDARNLEGTLGMRSHPCPSPSSGTLVWPDAGVLRAGMKEDRRGSTPGRWPCFTPGCPETLSSWMVWSCSLKGRVTTEPPRRTAPGGAVHIALCRDPVQGSS